MNIEGLRAKIEGLAARLDSLASSLVEVTTLARTTAAGDKDQANVAGNPANRQRPVRRASPWGLAGYPPAGILAVIVKAVASAFNGAVVGFATDQHGPQDLKEGETAVYAKPGQLCYLDERGNLIATPAVVNGAQGTVQIGGDGHPLPLWDTAEADLVDVLSAILKALTSPCVNGKPLYPPVPPPTGPEPI